MLILGGFAALAAPAMAQVSDTAGMTPPEAADPGTITVENTPEQQRLADKAVPPVVATEGEVKLAVDSEWWKFDKDRSGGLDRAEFNAMLHKFQKVALTGPKTVEEAGKAAAAAFAQADQDKDGKVNRDEFVGLLQSPAA
jgi:Ca2+-binding EF-hand superfamily protein